MDLHEDPAAGKDHDDRPPRVFVSYAHESPQHKHQVMQLCVLLRGQGIDVHIDEWDTDQRRDWYTWMIANITQADYILVVASPRYKATGDKGDPANNNRGVQTETALLRDLMHRDRAQWLPKMVPIVLPGASVDEIPIFLQPYGASHYLITDLTAAGVEDLIRLLTRQPAHIRPPLGVRPILPPHPPAVDRVHPAAAAVATLPRSIPAFTGREDELHDLLTTIATTMARRPSAVTIHAVDGMPGVGKTTFAVHAAHRLAEQFPDGQYFLDLHGHTPDQHPVDPTDALVSLLLAHGVKASQIPTALDDRARMWRDRVAGQNVLLVLDDAAGHDQVRSLLPGTPGGLVLITSRRRLAALEDVHPIPLDVLPPEVAAQMFHRLAHTRAADHDADAVAELMCLCGYLPLAIALQAGRLRSHPTWTVRYLTDQLAVTRDRLTAMQAENVAVAASFDLSYRDLAPDVQRLFRRLGLHPGPEIDVYAAAALDDSDPAATRDRLESLYLDRLLDEPAAGRYHMHNLIRDYATTRAGRDATDDQAVDRLLNYYLYTTNAANRYVNCYHTATYPITASPTGYTPELSDAQTALGWLAIERANLDACIEYAATHGRPSQAIQLVFVLHPFLRLHVHWDHAVTNLRTALTAAQLSGDVCGEANALQDLGDIQNLTGNFTAAQESFTRARDLFVALGDIHGEANALSGLATMQRMTGNYPAARESLTKAHDLYATLGDTHGQAIALYDLGIVQRFTAEFAAARDNLTRARALELARGDTNGEAFILCALGEVQRHTAEFAEARDNLTRARELFMAVGNTYGEIFVIIVLARVQILTGDYRAAEEGLIHAHQLCTAGNNNRDTAHILAGLGRVHYLTGDYPTARQELALAHDLYVTLGDPHGEATTLISLGVMQTLTEDYSTALASLTHAHTLFDRLGDIDGQAETLNSLGNLAHTTLDVDSAIIHYRNALQLARKIGSCLHEAHALEGIGRCLLRDSRTREGTAYLRQALGIYQRLGVPDAENVTAALTIIEH